MEIRSIGSLQVSAIGLGCNNFGMRIDETRSREVVHAALDAGVTFFDTADMYSAGTSEQFLGRALGSRREDVVVASKFGKPVASARAYATPEYIKTSIERSLRNLGTDRIDLYQLHEPHPETPIADTLGALDDLITAGKVREIGCSQFSADQLREAIAAAGSYRGFASIQNEYSLVHRDPERDVLPECKRRDVAFIPFYPLASGLLSGKYRRDKPLPEGSRLATGWGSGYLTDENVDKVEKLIAFAEQHGHTLLELSMSWLLRDDSVASVIAGATSAEQVRANARGGAWRMDADEIKTIDSIARPS